jgi:hypothetical protein
VALQALAAAGDSSRNTAALAWLHTQQNADGGFPFQAPSAFGTASDADSDALVLEALAATGQAVSSWQVSGNSPLRNLLSMQDAGGGISTPSPDTFTTSQVPPALVGKALPISAPAAGVVLPTAGCPVASSALAAASPAPALPAAGHPAAPADSPGVVVLTIAVLLVLASALALGVPRRQD